MYFGNHLASQGYIVIAPTHPGSDTEQAKAWIKEHGGLFAQRAEKKTEAERPAERIREKIRERREGEPAEEGPEPGAGMMPGITREGGWMMSTVSDPQNLRDRPRDISLVIDRIAAHPIIGPIADMQRIGVAGHSFGAFTAMAVGGMTVDLPETMEGKAKSFRDERVKAVLPMSPEGAGTMGISAGAWERFAVPALFLTGTKDYGSGPRSAAWRRQGFENAKSIHRYLVTMNDADHMTFANMGEKTAQQAAAGLGMGMLMLAQGDPKKQRERVDFIESLSMLFFDAYVRDDAEALKKLHAFCMSKRGDCVAEFAGGAKKPE
jgi:predicted dienelactone hydrolase